MIRDQQNIKFRNIKLNSADLNSRTTISDTIVAKFIHRSGIVGNGALWNGVYLPTCKKLSQFVDMFFTGLSCGWKLEDFMKSV
jgi:hypothetical protein